MCSQKNSRTFLKNGEICSKNHQYLKVKNSKLVKNIFFLKKKSKCPYVFSAHALRTSVEFLLESVARNLCRFQKCDVRSREHMSCFGKVHSASPSSPSPCFLCNDMQEPGLTLGTHVLWICSISFMLFVVKSSKRFLCFEMICAVYFYFLFSPPTACDCVCVEV